MLDHLFFVLYHLNSFTQLVSLHYALSNPLPYTSCPIEKYLAVTMFIIALFMTPVYQFEFKFNNNGWYVLRHMQPLNLHHKHDNLKQKVVPYKTGKFLQASMAQVICKFEKKKN